MNDDQVQDKPTPLCGWLAVDYGIKRVGLAYAPMNNDIAVGAGKIEGLSGRSLARAVYAEAKKRGVTHVLVGLPPEGAKNVEPVIEGSERLSQNLIKRGLTVYRWDESYTTAAALAAQNFVGGKAKPRNEWIDEASAILILQSYLDSLKN